MCYVDDGPILHGTRWVSIADTGDYDTACENCGALTENGHDDEDCAAYRLECALLDQLLDLERAVDWEDWERARAVADVEVSLELGRVG